jgi:hypothetical protein
MTDDEDYAAMEQWLADMRAMAREDAWSELRPGFTSTDSMVMYMGPELTEDKLRDAYQERPEVRTQGRHRKR